MQEIDKRNLINTLELSNYERDQAKAEVQNLKSQLLEFKSEYITLTRKFEEQKLLSMKHFDIKSRAEHKLSANMTEMLTIEKKLTSYQNQVSSLTHDNQLLSNQLAQFQIALEDLDKRKSKEVQVLEEHLRETRSANEELKSENSEYEEKLNDLTTKFNIMKKERDSLKSECENYRNTIIEYNEKLIEMEEKSRNINIKEKNYLTKIEQLKKEVEKYKDKVELEREGKNKLNEDYDKKFKKNNDEFQKEIDKQIEEYEEKLIAKEEENNITKGELLSMKIERDKYFSEYNILKSEIEKMNSTYREESAKISQKAREEEQKFIRIQSHFQDKIRLIAERNETLEKENKELLKKVNELTEKEKKHDDLYGKLVRNENELNLEIGNIKNRKEQLESENKSLKKKVIELELKCDRLLSGTEIVRKSLDQTEKEKDMYEENEKSIYMMMKKQREITYEMGKEYNRIYNISEKGEELRKSNE